MDTNTVIRVFDVLTAVSAIPAAALWFCSTRVETPSRFPIYVVEPRGAKPLMADGKFIGIAHSEALLELASGLSKQSKFNKWAAVFAGISAAFQALKLIPIF